MIGMPLDQEGICVIVSSYISNKDNNSDKPFNSACKEAKVSLRKEPLVANNMSETNHEESSTVYEIGYLIAPSVPEEKIPAEGEVIRGLAVSAGAEVIAEEAPHSTRLAYVMRKKNASGSYEKYDHAYFGWVKFAINPGEIDGIKKAIEAHPSVLRSLVMTTTRENTYLGKRASAVAADFGVGRASSESMAGTAEAPAMVARKEENKDVTPASIEEMDKSIEEMVKEA